MNITQAAILAPVMQAFADGEQIQYLSKEEGWGWQDIPDPRFSPLYAYRVKPVPREVWAVQKVGTTYVCDWQSTELAAKNRISTAIVPESWEAVHYVEVISD